MRANLQKPARYPAGGGASGSEHPKLVKTLPRFFNFYPWSLQYRELSVGMSSFSNTRQNMKFICYENNPTNLFFSSPSKSGIDSQGWAQLVIGQASESPPNQCQTTVLSYECLCKSYWNTWQLGRYDGSRWAYITKANLHIKGILCTVWWFPWLLHATCVSLSLVLSLPQ